MQSPYPSTTGVSSASPADSLGAHLRWQILLALGGVVLLALILGYSTYNVTTVLVPDRGGIYREGVAGNPQYMNPLLCQVSDVDMDLCSLLYRGLTKVDKEGRIVPDLASNWTVTDGVTYTFRLREDEYWHDGEQVTADDVLFTLQVLQDPEVYSLPGLASLWRTVQAEKLDDFTVRFQLSEPFTPFLDYTSLGLLPVHIWGDTPPAVLATTALDSTPVGTGPLRVTEVTADHILLEPSPFFRGEKPYISALELRFYPDHPSLLAAYNAGEIDGISQILATEIPAATELDDLTLHSFVQSSYISIMFNLQNPDTPFFQDKLVRQALLYGIDRERVIQQALDGQGIVAHSPILPENWAYNANVKQYPYDPARAAELLDQAGWVDTDGDGIRDKDGRPLQFLLHTNDDSGRVAVIEQVAQDWQQLGIRVVPTPVNFSMLVSDLLAPRRYEAALVGWEQIGDPDPYPLWHSTQATGGGQNYAGWDNEDADALMQEARSTMDLNQRKELYASFQDIFAEEIPAALLYYPVYTYGVRDRVQNVQIGSLNVPSERFNTFADWYIVTRRVPANQIPADIPPTPPTP